MREAFILEEGRRIFVIFSLFLRRGVRRDRDEMRGGFSVDRGREGGFFLFPFRRIRQGGKEKRGQQRRRTWNLWLVSSGKYLQ